MDEGVAWPRFDVNTQAMWDFNGDDISNEMGDVVTGAGSPTSSIMAVDANFFNNIIYPVSTTIQRDRKSQPRGYQPSARA